MSERSPLLSTRDSTALPRNENEANSHGPGESDQVPHLSATRGSFVAISIFILIFVLTFGVSVISTIQSSVARDLNITSGASWLTSTYLIAVTSVTPISGKICKIFSIRSYLLVSTVIQAVGLIITAFSNSLAVFIAGRVICGVGAASVTPVAFIAATNFSIRKYWGLLFGFINCGYTTGLAVGAVAGGALEPLIGWRACFWSQAPICLSMGIVGFFAMPPGSYSESKNEFDGLSIWRKLARIDYLGIATSIGGIVLLLYTMTATTFQAVPLVLAIALLVLFCFIESRVAVEPIIPMSVAASRPAFMTSVATIGIMCARWTILLYIPTYGIAVRCWTAAEAGLLMVPTNLGFGMGSVLVGALHIRKSASFYVPCLVCFGLFLIEHFAVSRVTTPDSPVWLLVGLLFLGGFTTGAILNYNLAHVLFLTRQAQHVVVIPLISMYRSLSGSLGSSLSGGIFQRSLQDALSKGFESKGLHDKDDLIAQLLSRPALVQDLDGPEKEVAISSYATAIQYLIAISCLWVVAVWFFQAGTGTTPRDIPQDTMDRKKSTGSEAIEDRESHVSR